MIPFLPAIAIFYTVRNLYKSNLSEEEICILECFLLLMEKQGLLSSNGSIFKEDIESLVRNSANPEIIELFNDFVKPIFAKSRKLFFDKLCSAVSSASLNLNEKQFLELFDNRLENYLGQSRSGDSLQPKELTQLLNSFLPEKENLSYYNPFGGLASLAIDLPIDISYYGEELNQNIWLLAKMRMLAYNCPFHFQFKNTNSIEGWRYGGTNLYDYICFNPPFNLKLDESFPHFLDEEQFGSYLNANSLIVSQTFKKLKEGGTMSFVMPSGFLFSSKPRDKAFRKYLVENNYIKFIIALPGKILRFTSIPVNVIVLSKGRADNKIRFVDGSEFYIKESGKSNKIDLQRLVQEIRTNEVSAYSKSVGLEEIEQNDYSLIVNRYVFEEPTLAESDEKKLVKLSSLIIPLPKEKPSVNKARLINIAELTDDRLKPNLDFGSLPFGEVKSSFSAIKGKALLISMLGNKIKPTLIEPTKGDIVYARGNILAFKIDTDKILPEYLVLELHKDYVLTQLKRIRGGSGIPRIKKDDLLNEIEIIVPALIEQERKISQAYYEVNQKQVAEVKKIATDYNIDVADENSFLRHQIAGSMKNLRNAFKNVKKVLDTEVELQIPELYNLKSNPKLPSTLGDYMRMMERDLGSITKALNKAGTQIELTDLDIEKIDLIKFIENYSTELESRNGNHFSVEIKKDEAALLENSVKNVFIYGDKEKLRLMLDNIIENAEKHGFENKIDTANKIVFEFLYDFKQAKVQLDISNSGKPLPEDYSHDSFIRKGGSSGKNAGEGTGGWLINEIMKLHKGHFGFTDETGPEGIDGDLVTSIELTFPIIIKQ